MTKVTAIIDLSELFQKLDLIEQRIGNIEEALISRKAKEAIAIKPIPQKTAIHELETTFPTFKRLCQRFNVRPIMRNGRVFYRPEDITRILYGKE